MDRGTPDGHNRFEEMAVAHVLGGLDDDTGREFRSHLLECGDCRARVGELRALAHDLADVERDERRLRAARAVETKRRGREADEEQPSAPPGRSRLVALMVVGAILALAAWNFTLRGNVDRLESALDASMAAAALLEFGEPGVVVQSATGVRGQVKGSEETMVLLVDGLDDERLYGLYARTDSGEVVYRRPAEPTGGRLFLMLPRPRDAATILLTAPQGPPAGEPSGLTVFEAQLPARSEDPTMRAPGAESQDAE